MTDTIHLLNRAGFGPALHDWPNWSQLSPQQAWDRLVKDSSSLAPLNAVAVPMAYNMAMQEMSDEERRAMQAEGRQQLKDVNVAWVQRMAHGPGLLRERMTLFWHDHFACRLNNARLAQPQNETIRQHALGKFEDLLLAVARDPGMLQFLNNQQNRKAHPNENFARELLELFTLGRGHYTEADIQAAARAFTGWGFNREGFVFRRWWHDEGEKTFLGQTGNLDGEDILAIILGQKQTARFLTEKLYRYFVNPQIDEQQIEGWAEGFFQSGYDIEALLTTIFQSDHFYETRHIGARVKSPVEYMVSLMRRLDLHFENDQDYLRIQRVLGQVLLQPPNVAGWPDHLAWIDSSSLMTRLRLPQTLVNQEALAVKEKPSFAGREDGFSKRGGGRFHARIAWTKLLEQFPEEAGDQPLSEYLLSVERTPSTQSPYTKVSAEDTPLGRMKNRCLRLLCTPEFQFC